MDPNTKDVRSDMPNYQNYKDKRREGGILGIVIQHSATVNPTTGAPTGNARTFFEYHVNERKWNHGAYHYVILDDGEIEYALDEEIAAYDVEASDPDYHWKNNYLAICLVGWFDNDRTQNGQAIPNEHTSPSDAQFASLRTLIDHLQLKHHVPQEKVQGGRELSSALGTSPGQNIDLDEVRYPVVIEEPPEDAEPRAAKDIRRETKKTSWWSWPWKKKVN